MSAVPPVRVSRGVPEAAWRALREAGVDFDVGGLDLAGRRALLCLLTDRVDAALLEAATELVVVANMAVGTDNVDLDCAGRLGIAVTNTPDVLTDATADLAMALLLAVARRIPWGDRLVRGGGFSGWRPDLGVGADVTGRTLGIVGPGRIGRAVAERARGFRMQVLFRGKPGGSAARSEPQASEVKLDELLERSDFVSLHVPLTPETHHLIGEPELRRMGAHAILINTARGPIVDERALVRALRAGWIAGAGLDVFEEEPRLAPGLTELPNAVLAPHLGSATVTTRNRMAELAARNVVAALRGEPLPNPVVLGERR